MIRLSIMAILAVTAHGFLSQRKLDGKRELVKVNFLNDYRQGDRFARSTGEGETFQFPEVLIFNVTVDGDVVTLTLHLSNVNRANPPVFVYEDGELVQREPQNSGRRALYQDVNSMASYLVTCNGPEPEQCSLHGSFYRGSQRYHMSPRTNIGTTGLHDLIHVGEVTQNFTGDYLVPPGHNANGVRNDGSAEPSRRSKRALPDANIVELLAMPDESVYQAFLAIEGTEKGAAEDAMELYYALLTNEMDLSYLSVPMVNTTLDLHIRVGLAGVIIAKNGNEATWSRDNTVVRDGTTYLNAYGSNGALRAFTYWRNLNRSRFIEHDHAMAFTMKDFAYVTADGISSGLLGQAWLGTVCETYDTSVTEDGGVRVAYIAAHELGHSLGAKHDSDENACAIDAYNVMTTGLYTTIGAAYAEAQWTFSTCSVDQFSSYINSLGSDHCMTKHKSIATDSLDDPLLLPGQYYSLDQQCQFRAGPSSSACSSFPVPESSCHYGISCNPSCNTRLYVLAGTPCGAAGENKWCYKGNCTEKPTNPTTTTTTTEEPTTTTTTEEPTTTTTTEEPTTTTTTEEPTTTTTTEEPTTTTTTEEPTTTTTTEEPTTTTTTEEPTTTTTTEEPTTTTTTEEPTTTTTTEEPTTTTTTEEPTTTTTTEEPTTTTTTEEPTTTTTAEEPTTTTTTEEPTTTTTTEEPTTTTTTEEPTTTTTTEEPTTTTTTEEPTTTTTTEEPTTTTTTEEPTTTTTTEEPTTTTTTEEPTTTTTTEEPTTTTTTEEPTTTTTTEEPTTTTTTEEPTTTTTTEEPATTTTTEEPTTTKKPKNKWCKKWCFKPNDNDKKKERCRGKNCCRVWWGKKLPCCKYCKK